ncbi:flagellar export chaperone FliS [Atopomonas sediminilitoris]|uniref:flagellar export chaperone FliS n=1 Tax=Atopomonas sediminilitoris TaxID=2919919 RepID=UPI001F4EBC2C|nr:flagellar export chaperone FliS [Atopomonas sediminilitoris]MCJ8167957.1 flagellar export chaperone FliS [Atopomonas sediminilitoris]
MNAMTALRQYQKVNTGAQVHDASPHRLIQMLLEGALDRLAKARGAIDREQMALKGEMLGKSMAIVMGLQQALDHEQGGEVAGNLSALYDYIIERLMDVSRNNQLAPLDEAVQLLRTIKSGWDGIEH